VTGEDDWHCSPVDDPTHLFEDHYLRVIRFVMHLGASQSDAEDVALEAFCEAVALAKDKPDYWLEIRSKEAWVRTVALRRYNRWSGPRERPLMSFGRVPDVPSLGFGYDEGVIQPQDVLSAVQALPEEERTVAAFDLDDFDTADISREMGIPEQRVRDVRQMYRAKLKLGLGGNNDSERRH
jgi:DNA-directed RNA polymerase specialized sigma24 family protein